jgi:Lysyl oxidase
LYEGIAVGWGDIYIPAKEGQAIDISGVPPGDYDLVHRFNAGRLLREADYSNDDSSLRIRLLPPPAASGLPTVEVLETCETGIHC